MEPFIDGGVLEVAAAVALGLTVNFIFSRKILLIIYSVAIILSPPLLFLLPRGVWFDVVAALTFLNAILLVILLWRERKQNFSSRLFDLTRFKKGHGK